MVTRLFDSIKAILESQGASLANIVDMTVFLTDMSHYGAMNKVGLDRYYCLPLTIPLMPLRRQNED